MSSFTYISDKGLNHAKAAFFIAVLMINICLISFASNKTENVIKGKIVDELTGLPVSGASVEASGSSDISDRDGRYFLKNLMRGTHAVKVTARDYMPQLVTIRVERGEASRDFVLKRARTSVSITGKVKDSVTGQSIKGATVRVGALITKTDGNGVYSFDSVDYGTHTLQIKANRYLNWGKNIDVHDDRTVFNVSVEPEEDLKVVRGRIVDSVSLKAIRGAEIESEGRKAVSDKLGRYTLVGLTEGVHELSVRAFGYVPTSQKIQVKPSRETIDIKLSKVRRSAVITGKVVSPDNLPVAGAVVVAGNARSVTDSAGEYRLLNVKEGPQEISVEARGYETFQKKVLVAPGPQDIRLNLSRNREIGEVLIIVRDRKDYRPVVTAKVNIAGIKYESTAEGRVLAEKIPVGDYPIEVYANGYVNVHSNVKVEKGRQVLTVAMDAVSDENKSYMTDIDVKSKPGKLYEKPNNNPVAFQDVEAAENFQDIRSIARENNSQKNRLSEDGKDHTGVEATGVEGRDYGHLEGLVSCADTGKPIPGVTISIGKRVTETDTEGMYQMKFLQSGNHEIVAYHDRYGLFQGRVDINGAATIQNLLLDVADTAGSLYGNITELRSGNPITNAVVLLGDRRALTDAAGKYRFAEVNGDYYKLRVQAQGFEPYEKIILLYDGAQKQDIFLNRPAASGEME